MIIAKYLPVEGEIKGGDKFITPEGYIFDAIEKEGRTLFVIDIATLPKGKNLEEYLNETTGKLKKVQLFVVTRDIEVGDEVCTYMTGKPWGKLKSLEKKGDRIDAWSDTMNIWWKTNAMQPLIKVLGRLSPNVTWKIKDGEKIEVVKVYDYRNTTTEDEFYYQVKGACGHYH